ncbi:MAG: glutamate dehydrogenase [Candidatus Endobugula sp.]|jgi:glutamate dehydrogenase
MTIQTPTKPKVRINEAAAEISARIPKKDQPLFATLISSFFNHIDNEDIARYTDEDLQGLMTTLYRKIQNAPKEKAIIFNPNVEEHGWQSPHTIVLLHHTNLRYLIDSIRNTLTREDIKIHNLFHSYLSVERSQKGDIKSISNDASSINEMLLYIEIDHHSHNDHIKDMRKLINQTIDDTDTVAQDYLAMSAMINSISADLDKSSKQVTPEALKESKAFLQWMNDGHFTFLAFDEYTVDKEGVKPVKNTELGLFRQYGQPKAQHFEKMTQDQLDIAKTHEPIIFAKSGHISSVHRSSYSDYIVVKKFDAKGNIIGGYRFMGLYKHNVYTNSANNIPVIRQKIQDILDESSIAVDTYDYFELSRILNTFPKDELFLASNEYLLNAGRSVLFMRERAKIKLFLRESIDNKFITAILYAPRNRLTSKLQEQIYDLLSSHIESESSTTSNFFSESSLARCRFVFRLKAPLKNELHQQEIESEIIELARDWNEDLQSALNDAVGEEKGITLYRQYRNAFPTSYIEENNPRVAVADIERIQKLAKDDNSLTVSFYRLISAQDNELKIKIYHKGTQLSLSDMIPVLENFGLKVLEELPYEIEQEKETFWIHTFTVDSPFNPDLDPSEHKENLSEAFSAIWQKKADDDTFNELILKAGVTWRQVSMLRAYSRYMKQIKMGFSQKYIANSLVNHTSIAKKLIGLFDCRFNPGKKRSEKTAQRIIEQLESLFEQVESLSEDKILRQYIELIQATLRTNFFQKGLDGADYKDYLSLKLNPSLIKDIPLPRPMFEIFVYSPRVEGVHLRGGKVARGGLRWSDRSEDFRTEVLGLVKAQQVKNAVIVPVGAKGGFIAKQLPSASDRNAFLAEGISCYKLFIRGLLDLTDNLNAGEVVPPKDLVRYDDDDTYLVVAADKGTATFSDIANEISIEYNHWLGDAFASGGSNGYDHKKMGITARGAWVSVQRHFREKGMNIQKEPFTVVGIGDMSGDVFGNGMLLSDQIKLVSGFNHMHIFIDPNPDTASSFVERQRLFDMPRSSWQDYNQKLISKGGGIFSRTAKSISLSPEIQALVCTTKKVVPPSELLSLLLKAPVDMLWNGGIGTYAKASTELHTDVGDKANDILRVDAKDLQCRVIGEGGNLGITQKARIEYGLHGGSVFTDFIDNAAGVDCSDHEVNIKILLDKQVADGELTEKQRNRYLESMTEDVADLVLKNNYQQTQAISLSYIETHRRTEEYRRVIQYLESTGKLNRALEFLPTDETLAERKSRQEGLTQAELSILISYVKADMKEALIHADLGNDAYMSQPIETAFPAPLNKKFPEAVNNHPLKKEIIATQIANDIFNHLSISYLDRMQQSTGVTHADIAKAYIATKEIFALNDIWSAIEALDYKVESELQYHMMLRVSRLVRRASRWLIKNHRTQLNASTLISLYAERIQNLGSKLPTLLPEALHEQWKAAKDELVAMGAPVSLAETLSSCEYLYDFLGIISASNSLDKDITIVASSFFTLAERLDLDDFSEHLEKKMPTTTHWQSLARESLRDDLEWQQRQLTQNMLGSIDACDADAVQAKVDDWLGEQEVLTARWKHMITELNNHNDGDISMLSIAIRELSDLSQATVNS